LRAARPVARRAISGLRELPPWGDTTQSLVALALNSTTSFVAGTILAAITGTLEAVPGLLMLVPAAIGLRGNVFSALGSRLSTAIHLGTFRFSARRDSVLVQNVAAAMVLTMAVSVLLALAAKGLGIAVAIDPLPAPLLDLALVAVLGGLLASLVVLGATLLLTLGAVRFEWDLDNLVAPIVSTLGDVLTIPALWVAAQLLHIRLVAQGLSVLLMLATIVVFGMAWRAPLPTLRRVTRESLPILCGAAGLSMLAGLTLQSKLGVFNRYKALYLLELAFVSSAGALGGILSSRLATGFQLGTMDPDTRPGRAARRAALAVAGLAVPVMTFNAIGAHLVAVAFSQSTPGLLRLLVATAVAGVFTIAFVLAVAYYGTLAAFRVGLDPDNYGVPLVTSSVDFVGALALVITLISLHLV
jgi:mgtE-like transporter